MNLDDRIAYVREAMKSKSSAYQKLLDEKANESKEFGKAISFFSGGTLAIKAPKRRFVALRAVDSEGKNYTAFLDIKSFVTFIERCQILKKRLEERIND